VCGEVGTHRQTRRAQPKTVDCAPSSESFVPKGTVHLSVLVVKCHSVDSGEKLGQIWHTSSKPILYSLDSGSQTQRSES